MKIYSVDRYNCSRKLFITTNLSCNLNCVYCYEKNKNDKVLNVQETLDKLLPILQKKTELGTIVKLLGGEPFLVFEQIKELCEAIWSSNVMENVLIHTTTNGTLVHDNIQKWLEVNKRKITVKLSLDGNREAQELNRQGSFDKIDIDFFNKCWPEIGVKMTISPISIHLFASSIMYMHSRGIMRISPSFAEFVDWTRPELFKIFYREMSALLVYYKEHIHLSPCTFFEVPFRHLIDMETEIHPCTIGASDVIDFYTGKKYPCIFYLPSVCGHEKSEQLMGIDLKEIKNVYSEICRKCMFAKICRTCYAANFIRRGATYNRDMALCEFHKIRFVFSVKYMYFKYIEMNHPLPEGIKGRYIYRDLLAIHKIWPLLEKIERKYQ